MKIFAIIHKDGVINTTLLTIDLSVQYIPYTLLNHADPHRYRVRTPRTIHLFAPFAWYETSAGSDVVIADQSGRGCWLTIK